MTKKNKGLKYSNHTNGNGNGKKNNPDIRSTSKKDILIKYSILGSILIFTFLIFSDTLHYQFVNWDDPFYVLNNLEIKNFSFEGFKKIFTTPIIGMYNPITFVVYAFEYKFWGLNPKTFHLFNLLFHLIATVTVFNFIYNLSKRYETATIVALLFAIHPMHISAVTWISQTKTSLYLIFYFLALNYYLKYIKDNYKIKYLVYISILFILSCLSKPSAVTLAPIMLLLDYYLSRKIDKRLILEKIPFFAIALFFGILTLMTHGEAEDSIFEVSQNYSLFNNILVSNYSIVFYINKLFFPFNLCTIYPYPETTPYLPLKYYFSLPIIPIILFLIYKAGNFRKEMIFGLLFFAIAISVLIRFVPSGFFRAANRYTYLSYTGLFYIIGQFYVYIIDNKFPFARKLKTYVIALLAILVILCSVLTVYRIPVWENSITLFTDIIKKKPKLALAYNNRAIAKKDIGDNQGAIDDFTKAVEIDPTYFPGYNNRGEIKRLLNDEDGALIDYNKAIDINPKYVEAYNNRGIIYFNKGKLVEALTDYNTAIILNPKNGASFHNRGLIRLMQKDTLNALTDFEMAAKLGIEQSHNMTMSLSTTTTMKSSD